MTGCKHLRCGIKSLKILEILLIFIHSSVNLIVCVLSDICEINWIIGNLIKLFMYLRSRHTCLCKFKIGSLLVFVAKGFSV